MCRESRDAGLPALAFAITQPKPRPAMPAEIGSIPISGRECLTVESVGWWPMHTRRVRIK
jgi:hypothetical protein